MRTSTDKITFPAVRARDWLWLVAMLVLLAWAAVYYHTGDGCPYLATDFRGYYASAQIMHQSSLTAIYDQPTQDAYQSALPYRCPDGTLVDPLLRVSVPYLPVFTLLFWPLAVFDFTTSFWLWSALNVVILILYLRRFARAWIGRSGGIRLLQWMICLPLLANLSLGQSNVWLVICLGEFSLALERRQGGRSGLWLAGLLLKPHLLVLLLPGLLLSRQSVSLRWGVLCGFLTGAAAILGFSFLLVGRTGMQEIAQVVRSFASSSFLTAYTMMNWRSLALNLTHLLPDWAAWAVAIVGMAAVAGLVLWLWQARPASGELLWLMLATMAGTLAIAWHANYYLLILLIPFLFALDLQGKLPTVFLWTWILAPPLIYALAYMMNDSWARIILGTSLLFLNLLLLGWSARQVVLSKTPVTNHN